MSLAGAPAAAPISLAAATGRALPRRLLALIADTFVISLLDEIVNGTFGVTRVTSGIATTMGSGGYPPFTNPKTSVWGRLGRVWGGYYSPLWGVFWPPIRAQLAPPHRTDPSGL